MLRMRRFHPRSVVVLNLPYIGQVADGAAEEITASEARLQPWKKDKYGSIQDMMEETACLETNWLPFHKTVLSHNLEILLG